jgi:protein-tyrosine phosphatase
MVDIHTHVLSGLDDGARTVEESLKMLKLAARSGTTDLVATPHANGEYAFDEQLVQQVFRDLSDKSSGFIKLHLGCDFHLNGENLEVALCNPERYTINHECYLMVELPDLVSLRSVRRDLERLLDVQISPIITHPERNYSIRSETDELKRWVDDGCFLQVTAQSLLGRFGTLAKKAADCMLSADLVDFVASDAHNCTHRPPDLSKAYEYVSSRYGADRAHALFVENPHSALWGKPIAVRPMVRRKVFGFLGFWK